MKRRELVKGLSLVVGGAVCADPALAVFARNDDTSELKCAPIRALLQKDGGWFQPIQVTVHHSGPPVNAITRLNGINVDSRTLTEGDKSFDVLFPAVSVSQQVRVDCELAGRVQTTMVSVLPIRKVVVYILPHSHHDLGYTDLQANVEEKQMRNISMGMDLAQRTASYPEGARFVWNLEVLWGADLFLRRKPEAEKAAFVDAVKRGWIGLNGMYANELTGICRSEELLQLFRYAGELGRQCGIRVNSAMLSDVPGFTWGTVTAMAQAGIRYFSAAPNFFDRIGTFMEEWQDKPFWWISPSGREKVLVWVPWTGYAMSHVMKIGSEWVGKYQERLDAVNFPYDTSYIRWSGHGDNAEPDPEISEFVKAWSQEYAWPKFVISSTSDAFSAFEKRHGGALPKFSGDLTPYWEDGAGSSALETAMNRSAADRLIQAEALAAMLAPASYKVSSFNEAWRNVLLYSEHTWGAWCSVSDSENPFTKKQWDVKRAFAVNAQKESEDLISRVLGAVPATPGNSAIDVHNSTSWPRTEVVVLSRERSAAGDRVKDAQGNPVPSQRLVTGELAFLAPRVPPFGSTRFHLSQGAAHVPNKPVIVHDGVLDNGILRVRIDPVSGNVVELRRRGQPANLVNTVGGESVNQYLFLNGRDLAKVQTSGVASILEEERGPLVACLRIESSAPGCNSLVRRVRLTSGADWLDFTNIVDKKRAPLNPHPGEGGPGDEFAQHGAKESVQFAFPFSIDRGTMHVDAPLAIMQPEVNQLPGSCKNWLPVGRWIDVSNAESGVTWVSLDAPLVEVGEMSATMLGSQKDPGVWRAHIAQTQKFYSWVMNNHWGTNYRAYQEGPVTFRYALRPHVGYNPAAASRLAIGLSQPLLSSPARGTPAEAVPLFQVEPDDVLAVTVKPSDDCKALIVRLFGASCENRRAKLVWKLEPAPRVWFSDLSEQALELAGPEIPVAGQQLVTLRIEQA